MPKVDWLEERRTTLTDEELGELRAEALGEEEVASLLVSGRCPTCEHVTRQIVPVQVLTQGRASTAAASPSADAEATVRMSVGLERDIRVAVPKMPSQVPVVVTCRCASEHPGALGKFGCGRSWMVRVGFDPAAPGDATVARPTPKDLSLWPIAIELGAVSKDPLKPVREAADKWQKALAALVGTVGLVAAVGGRDGLAKLSNPYDDLVVIGLGLFLLLSTWGTYLAHQAAIGVPTFDSLKDNASLEKWVAQPLAHAAAATDRLKSAISVSLVAFLIGLATLALFWRAPSASPPSPIVQATFTTQEKVCGTLVSVGREDVKLRRKLDGEVVTRPSDTLQTLAPAAC